MSVQSVNNISVGSASSVRRAIDIANGKKTISQIKEVAQRTSQEGHRERAKNLIHAFNHTDEVVYSRNNMTKPVGKLSDLVNAETKELVSQQAEEVVKNPSFKKMGAIGASLVAVVAAGLAIKHFVVDKKQAQEQPKVNVNA